MVMKVVYLAVSAFISSTNNIDQTGAFDFTRVTNLKDLFSSVKSDVMLESLKLLTLSISSSLFFGVNFLTQAILICKNHFF